jgi:hypothetical protein
MRRYADETGEWQSEHTLSMVSRPGPGGKRAACAAVSGSGINRLPEVNCVGKRFGEAAETIFDPDNE